MARRRGATGRACWSRMCRYCSKTTASAAIAACWFSAGWNSSPRRDARGFFLFRSFAKGLLEGTKVLGQDTLEFIRLQVVGGHHPEFQHFTAIGAVAFDLDSVAQMLELGTRGLAAPTDEPD